METINLIPQEERVQQAKTKVVKFSTILSVIIMIITVLAGGFFFYKAYTLKEQVGALDSSINQLRTDIGKLSDIEINARNLFSKSIILKSIFEERTYYSVLLEEFKESVPSEVSVESFGLAKENSMSVSGKATTYNAIQDFSNRLLERPIFTEVQLNSVGLESQEEKVNYFIVVSYDGSMLHK